MYTLFQGLFFILLHQLFVFISKHVDDIHQSTNPTITETGIFRLIRSNLTAILSH